MERLKGVGLEGGEAERSKVEGGEAERSEVEGWEAERGGVRGWRASFQWGGVPMGRDPSNYGRSYLCSRIHDLMK